MAKFERSESERRDERIKQVEEHGTMTAAKSLYLKYLRGEVLTPMQTIRCKCYDCMGFCADGKLDCKVPLCPIYAFMPYRDDKPKREKRVVTEEQKQSFLSRMKISRDNKSQDRANDKMDGKLSRVCREF